MLSSFDVGLCAQFAYPKHNFTGVRSEYETRRIKVKEVRDIGEFPLDPETLDLQPLLRRGRTLITGWDFDRQADRSFYLESMQEIMMIDQPTYGSEPDRPERFAVVELTREKVVARGMYREEADAFARRWSKWHGMTVTVAESVNWQSDAQVLEQLQLVR